MFGAQSLIFYAASSWIPFRLHDHGPAYLSLVLLLLNAASVPVTFVLVALPWPWATSRGFYAAAAALMTAGTGLFAVGPTGLAWVWAGVLGVGTSMTFAGTLALPALFAPRAQAAGYAALVLTAGYVISFAGPFLGGVLLDATGRLDSPFWLMTAVAGALLALGLTLPRRTPAPES
jgi:CP family cyanate transporter-like MFS transporter